MSKAYGYKPSSIAGGVGVRHPEGRVYLNLCGSYASLREFERTLDLPAHAKKPRSKDPHSLLFG